MSRKIFAIIFISFLVTQHGFAITGQEGYWNKIKNGAPTFVKDVGVTYVGYTALFYGLPKAIAENPIIDKELILVAGAEVARELVDNEQHSFAYKAGIHGVAVALTAATVFGIKNFSK